VKETIHEGFNMTELSPEHQFLRADLWEKWPQLQTDQKMGLAAPPIQKPCPTGHPRIKLTPPDQFKVGDVSLIQAIGQRRSHRIYTPDPLTIEELSFLLWATQYIQKTINQGVASLRCVPSGGARHPFETYLAVQRVHHLAPGLYRYLALEHQLAYLHPEDHLGHKLAAACADFGAQSAVTFAWTAIPYRTEWRYGPLAAKLIAQDSGHVCQNLYLACQAIQAGTCAVDSYNQDAMDALLGIDGVSEFTIYCAPVGKVRPLDQAAKGVTS
jgi:SagB-type dehydrogenase family enzyme